ncbi:hypothetical protein [Brevibacterium senegalense]|uniref:hypothetical protein n=1 Tax=Brevibacterium senegalense TaxID=1033736 RepID=UPI00031D3E7A|nr:hypothetical protein [Brevibacterium senegalense]
MSTRDPRPSVDASSGGAGRRNGGRGAGLSALRVSPTNAVFSLLFAVAGVLFWVYDTWLTGLVFLVAAVAQYGMALMARRGRGVSDLWRASAFEPGDERDRAILLRSAALVGYVVGVGSMVLFLFVLLLFQEQRVLLWYLAGQTIVVNAFWGAAILVMTRRG